METVNNNNLDFTFVGNNNNNLFQNTEIVELPSRGLIYPLDNPLSNGKIELRYMTAKDEDILMNQSYIRQGIVFDKLIQSLIIDKNVKYDDLIIGDKNALLFSARIMAYGERYDVKITCPSCNESISKSLNLREIIKIKEINPDNYNHVNLFEFRLPNSGKKIKFKILTHKDEIEIDNEIKGLKKAFGANSVSELTIRLKRMILSVDDETDKIKISRFIENELLARDSYEFRKYLKEISPDVNTEFEFECNNCGTISTVTMPLTVEFFYPRT